MLYFPDFEEINIPDGSATIIRSGNHTLWRNFSHSHVSFGDSIATGHAIDENWSRDYYGTQYGQNGRKETVIVPGCYVDLMHQEMLSRFGNKVLTTSFARSGDKLEDMMDKLTHDIVKVILAEADFVTICISANNVLGPFEKYLETYIRTGNLEPLIQSIESNLAKLDNDSDPMSFISLFNRLYSINPDATYVFTTIYNPYKYLWIDEGSDGFFAPLLSTIPNMTIMGFDIDNIIKDQLLKQDIVEMLFDRANGLPEWAERFVSQLNSILKSKINSFQKSNFVIADTKTLFEIFPDRPVSAAKHYNDLVSVEFTRGYDITQMDWGLLWADSNVVNFWWGLAEKYVSLSGIDMSGLANDLVNQIIEKIIMADVDPHPETYGHYIMKRSFTAALGWEELDSYTITFNANGGTGTMASQTVPGVDGQPSFLNLNTNTFTGQTGYYFNGWNTKADGTGTTYTNGQLIGISSDITLYAQWSNVYKITYKHTNKTVIYTDNETGHMECYELWIEGQQMEKLGKFSDNKVPVYSYPYGTNVGVVVRNYNPNEITYDNCDCDIYFNGVNVSSGYRGTTYDFVLTSDITIEFQWKISGSLVTFDACSWEDCYITTS